MPTTDLPPTPEERFREVAVILAAGLLRLKTRPQVAPTVGISRADGAPQKSSESAQISLGFPATPWPDPPDG
jgi:hypothetical protein